MSDDPRSSGRPSGWLGHAATLGGRAVRLAAQAIDTGIDRAATTLSDAEKAFREGRDPNVEEAKIIEERDNAGKRNDR